MREIHNIYEALIILWFMIGNMILLYYRVKRQTKADKKMSTRVTIVVFATILLIIGYFVSVILRT